MSSRSFICSSTSVILLLVLSCIFFNLCYHVVYWWLYIIYLFQSLLNIYCNFLIHASFYLAAPPFYFWDFGSSLLSFFWILFQVDSLSPPLLFDLGGTYHVPLPVEYFSAFSFCLDCCVWGTLSVGWMFKVPLYCGVCSLWVGLDWWLVKISRLGETAPVFWCVELDFFSLECNEVSSSEFWCVYGLGMALGSLSFNAQGCVPALLENSCGMSCCRTCWLLGGAWFQCRYGGFWVSSCLLVFPGIRSSLMFSSFGIKPPASGFQLYSTVASRLLHPYSTKDKTSRLMVKQFSTARDTQRGSQSYMRREEEEGDRGDQEEKRESQKGREQSSQ